MCPEHTSRKLAYFLQNPGHLHSHPPEPAQQPMVVLALHAGPFVQDCRSHAHLLRLLEASTHSLLGGRIALHFPSRPIPPAILWQRRSAALSMVSATGRVVMFP